jgi:hypothetical protein
MEFSNHHNYPLFIVYLYFKAFFEPMKKGNLSSFLRGNLPMGIRFIVTQERRASKTGPHSEKNKKISYKNIRKTPIDAFGRLA